MMIKEISEKKQIKIVIAGDGATGKTTISKRLNETLKLEENLVMTTGIEFHTLEITKQEGNAVIWDLAGKEQFRPFQESFFHDADIVILVFSVEWFPSYMNIESWLSMVDRNRSKKLYLIANKVDINNKAIRTDEALEYARERGMDYFEISTIRGDAFREFEQNLIQTAISLRNGHNNKNHERIN